MFLGSAILSDQKLLQQTISALRDSGRELGLRVTCTEYDVSQTTTFNDLNRVGIRFEPGAIVVVHNANTRKLPWAVRHLILCSRHARASIVLVNSYIHDKNLLANIDVTDAS